jgi:hypothetical protein
MAAKAKTQPKLRPALPKTENGIVDYRSLISPQNLKLNPWAYSNENIDVATLPPEEIERLLKIADDSHLLILLPGFRELAQKRGVKEVDTSLVYHDSDWSIARCAITFLPSEDEPEGATSSDLGDANVNNTSSTFHSFISTIAANRAYIRALRSYFRIQSLGWEEINTDEKIVLKNNVPYPLQKVLKEKMEEKSITFEQLKEIAMNSGKIQEWKEEWVNVESLSHAAVFVISPLISALQ